MNGPFERRAISSGGEFEGGVLKANGQFGCSSTVWVGGQTLRHSGLVDHGGEPLHHGGGPSDHGSGPLDHGSGPLDHGGGPLDHGGGPSGLEAEGQARRLAVSSEYGMISSDDAPVRSHGGQYAGEFSSSFKTPGEAGFPVAVPVKTAPPQFIHNVSEPLQT
ncbi:hypothetical protein BV898_00937 [Hypsibius exemplaris]|uniref:Uncharacterized protein n=1 Tax=Hypsibius exemplaris TaxID=2072580 RepID=A0A1W0XD07_HYPEX|nr:hypothetical protein BV898_00937 [Hypsibius exemplaris]